jgi:nitroreductase
MTELLALDSNELLSTTRAVRKRLDLDRPVPLEVVREALAVAMQAPSGGNAQQWHWIVLTDPEVKAQVAAHYKRSYDAYRESRPATTPAQQRMASSSDYLSDVMARVPVLVIGAISVGDAGLSTGNQAGVWGSLLPAAWSLQLALRARGLGSAWTTLHLVYETDVAQLLGLPDHVRQGVLLPVAYTKGTDFKPGPRADLDAVVHVNGW